MSVIDSIVRDLNELPPAKLLDVAHYVHALNPKSADRRQAALRETAGCLDDADGADFEQAVRAEAERLDDDTL